jgi:hypothetical protein
MKRKWDPDDGTPTWLVLLALLVFGGAMFFAGYFFAQLHAL